MLIAARIRPATFTTIIFPPIRSAIRTTVWPAIRSAVTILLLRRRLLLKTWRLDATQRPAQFFDLAFVRQFLAFGEFHQLKDLIELIHRMLQRFRDLRRVQHGLMDG